MKFLKLLPLSNESPTAGAEAAPAKMVGEQLEAQSADLSIRGELVPFPRDYKLKFTYCALLLLSTGLSARNGNET